MTTGHMAWQQSREVCMRDVGVHVRRVGVCVCVRGGGYTPTGVTGCGTGAKEERPAAFSAATCTMYLLARTSKARYAHVEAWYTRARQDVQ